MEAIKVNRLTHLLGRTLSVSSEGPSLVIVSSDFFSITGLFGNLIRITDKLRLPSSLFLKLFEQKTLVLAVLPSSYT